LFEETTESTRKERTSRQRNGLMMQWEKEMIAKIQISQLVTDNPYKDDFYYKIYTSIAPAPEKELQSPREKGSKSRKKSEGASKVANRMQQQMQRLIDKRKQKKEEKTHGNSFLNLYQSFFGRCFR